MSDIEKNTPNAQLKMVAGDDVIEFSSGKVVVLGRGERADKKIVDPELSRLHAKLSYDGEFMYAEDLGSQNGTFINGRRISSSEKMSDGDVLSLSSTEFRVCLPEIHRQEEILDAKTRVFATPASWAISKDEAPDDSTSYLEMGDLVGKSASAQELEAEVNEPTIICVSGANEGKRFVFSTREKETSWTLGSDSQCEIKISGNGVSKSHAEILNRGLKWEVCDALSQNGTYVNGRKITKAYLDSGDKLSVGETEWVFLSGSSASSRSGEVNVPKKNRFYPNVLIAFAVVLVVMLGVVFYSRY